MDNKAVKILIRMARILLPLGALVLSLLHGSYQMPVKETAESTEIMYRIATNYLDLRVFDSGNWCPLLCTLLLGATVVTAIVCLFKETENSLVTLATFASLALVACLGNLVFIFELTWQGWCIVMIQILLITVTAVQEIRMENARKGIKF